ncbi:fimbrial protein [Paraburkholderia elongata]|uniref:Type 1 fimbrial protein n=1 Tax=Paraburkholderia elongata TaxID=2675747 RepID=A0A972NKP7_9BURK|nr:fimbrial protein [Paraburkholderia elongata]NPT53360.1 type 1 fimbrial protein [Paraburkholderia elongata]
MKSILPVIAIATGSLLGLASFGAHAADGTITITGSIADSTCSINGVASGTQANLTVPLQPVSSGSLSAAGATAGTSNQSDMQLKLTGCSGTATKAIARFENGSTVDQTSGNLLNSNGTATNVQVRLLNAQMAPINIVTSANNVSGTNSATITGGAATVGYFAQYYATGKATAGTVNTTVQYSMQYQ